MPINRTWNNVIDATEVVISSPVAEKNLDDLGFPSTASRWLTHPTEMLKELHTNCGEVISRMVTTACVENRVTLQLIEPEEIEFNPPRWYVAFGTTPTIAKRLDLGLPNWVQLERELQFSIPNTFVSFAESWPGLVFGTLYFPAFLLPSSDWLRHETLSPYDGQGRPLIDGGVLDKLKRMILFQVDYWTNAKLLDCNGTVWQYQIESAELTNTELLFADWLENEISNRIKSP